MRPRAAAARGVAGADAPRRAQVRRRTEWRKTLERGAGEVMSRAARMARSARFSVTRSTVGVRKAAASVAASVVASVAVSDAAGGAGEY